MGYPYNSLSKGLKGPPGRRGGMPVRAQVPCQNRGNSVYQTQQGCGTYEATAVVTVHTRPAGAPGREMEGGGGVGGHEIPPLAAETETVGFFNGATARRLNTEQGRPCSQD